MKIVQTKLYRFDELGPEFAEQAIKEWNNSFLNMLSVYDIWFTSTGLIYPIFNT